MSHVDALKVFDVLRDVAAEIILPRYQRLAASDIREKRPGDLVTIADTEAEIALSARLRDLLPGSSVVGEEAVAADDRLLDHLNDPGDIWIIDPIDGTKNFVKGRRKFAIIVALVHDGHTVQGWIHDPLGARTVIGELGQGAWLGERRLCLDPAPPIRGMSGSAGFRHPEGLAGKIGQLVTHGSTAHDYLDLVSNRLHFAYFRRLHPWDHAAGVLLHAEAGGYGALLDGRPYRPVRSKDTMLLAPDRQSWDALKALILG